MCPLCLTSLAVTAAIVVATHVATALRRGDLASAADDLRDDLRAAARDAK